MRRLFVSGPFLTAVLAFGLVSAPMHDASATTSLSASPHGLHFGAVPVGTSSDPLQITLTNNTGTLLALGAPGTTNPTDFSLAAGSPDPCGTNLAAGASCEEGAVFNPQTSGQQSGDFQIAYKVAACSQSPSCWSTLSVGMRGRGT